MNVLVTNTQTPQAYAIIRALRPHATRIVATTEAGGRGRLSHAANSRLVDSRYSVPSPVNDWWHGNITIDNTPAEAAFVEAAARICERERIDVIFPSWDPYVYVLSKNQPAFEKLGVLIPVPAFDTLLTALDKYRTVEAGQRVGFPCPRTYLFEDRAQLEWIAAREAFPLVIKPRFTSGGRGMAIVRDTRELYESVPAVVSDHGRPMIQEYIPGGERDSAQFVLDRDGRLVFAFHKKRHRKFRRTARYGTVSESVAPDGHVARMAGLLDSLGWWGAMGVETISDPRDGVDKLMEINPRFPRQLWNRTELGINEPWMCVRIARGEKVEPERSYPHGVLFVSPIEDVQLLALQLLDLAVYRVQMGLRGRTPLDRLSPPPSLAHQLRSFLGTYRSRQRKVWDPYFKYFFQDPLVSLLWWLEFSTWMAGGIKQLGR